MVALHMHRYIAEGVRITVDVQRLDRGRKVLAGLGGKLNLARKVPREVRRSWETEHRSDKMCLPSRSQLDLAMPCTVKGERSSRELEELIADLDWEDAIVRRIWAMLLMVDSLCGPLLGACAAV